MENYLHASKRRGRPVGSKNKRKEPEPSAAVQQDGVAIQLKVLEVAAGADVINAVSDFAKHFKVNVSVISTHGLVHNLTVFRPKPPPQISSVISFEGIFDLLSLKGNFHGSVSSATRPSPYFASHLIYFVDGEGNAVGGIVAGRVLAATKVLLVVTILRETDCVKLPLTSPSSQAIKPIVSFHQPEVCASSRGSMSGYGDAPCPTPPLRLCNRIANGYLCTCALK